MMPGGGSMFHPLRTDAIGSLGQLNVYALYDGHNCDISYTANTPAL